jgi:hypothetical protein
MVGQPEQPVHFLSCDEATLTEVGERILHVEELRSSHREVAAELAVSESTEAFRNQGGRRTRRLSKLIAEFEIGVQRSCGRYCHYRIAQLRGELPSIEFLEPLGSHASERSIFGATVIGGGALQHSGTSAPRHWTSALQHFGTPAPTGRPSFSP